MTIPQKPPQSASQPPPSQQHFEQSPSIERQHSMTETINATISSSSGATTSNSAPGSSAAAVRHRRVTTERSVLPLSADIAKNREFYRTHDVRPPYTYASLIR